MKSPQATEFAIQYERIINATGATSDADLARILGITQPSVCDTKARKSIPKAWLIKVHDMFGTSIDWLLFGDATLPVPPATATANEPPRIRTEAECRKHIEAIFPNASKRHNSIETLNTMLCDIQMLMDDLDQRIKRGAYAEIFGSRLAADTFGSHIRTIDSLIRVIRNPLVFSAAEERGGNVSLKDIDHDAIKHLHAMLVAAVNDTAY